MRAAQEDTEAERGGGAGASDGIEEGGDRVARVAGEEHPRDVDHVEEAACGRMASIRRDDVDGIDGMGAPSLATPSAQTSVVHVAKAFGFTCGVTRDVPFPTHP